MSFQVIMTEDAKKSVEKSGVSVEASVEAEYGPVSGSASGSRDSKSSKTEAFSKAKMTTKAVVLGGIPPSDLRKGFGEWAATVAEHPMPVKYTLRPFSQANSNYIDGPTYSAMLSKYVSQMATRTQQKRKQAKLQPKGPPTLKVGETWDSEKKGGYTWPKKDGSTLQILNDGTFTIADKNNNVVFDTIFTTNAPSRHIMKLEKDGDLTVKHPDGTMIWHSVTGTNACDGKSVGKAVFDKGVLKVIASDNTVTWTSDTAGSGAAPKRAPAASFGGGKNMCITSKNCVTIFGSDDYKGKTAEMGPGYYDEDWLKKHNSMDSDNYSIKVNEEVCWSASWEGYTFSKGKGTGDDEWHTKNEADCSYRHIEDGTKVDSNQGSNDANSYIIRSTANYQQYWSSARTKKCSEHEYCRIDGSYDNNDGSWTSRIQKYYPDCVMPLGYAVCQK